MYYSFTLVTSVSVRTYIHFQMIICVNINGFSSNRSMCIEMVAFWFGIANGQISSRFGSYLPPQDSGEVLVVHIFIFFVLLE